LSNKEEAVNQERQEKVSSSRNERRPKAWSCGVRCGS
jgi:hypothetical protein